MTVDLGFLLVLAGLAIVLVALGLLLRYKRRLAVPRRELQDIARDQDVHVPHQFVNKVVSYIDASLNLGYSTQDIYDHLKTLGWSEERINDSFKRFELLGTYHEMKQNNLPDQEILDALAKDYQPQQIEEALNHHSAIIGKDAGIEGQMRHLQQVAENHTIVDGQTTVAKLKRFISVCYRHGYPKDLIQRLLVEKGLARDKIEKVCSGLMK